MNRIEVMRRIEELERQKIDIEDMDKVFIQETIYLGKFKDTDIYRVAVQDRKPNASTVLYKYFDGDAKLRGVKNETYEGEKEWLQSGDEEWEQIKDEIDKNEAQIEEEIEQLLGKLEISKEDIERISEIDLAQKILENEEEQEEKEDDEEQVKDNKTKNKKEQKKEKYSQTNDFKDIRTEVSTDTKVDQKGHTLGSELGLSEYTKIAIINSDKLSSIRDENGNALSRTTKGLAIIGFKQVGGKQVVEKIPDNILRYYRGSQDESIRFDSDDKVEKNTELTGRFVKPGSNRGLAVEISEMRTKVFYQGSIDLDDNTPVMIRVEDKYTGKNTISTETRELLNSNKGIWQADKYNREADEHREDNGEKIHRDNADGNLDTASGHIHGIETPDDTIQYHGELMKVSTVAKEMNLPLHIFIGEYNKRAEELEGIEDIDINEDLYLVIKERASVRRERAPKREEGGRTPGDDSHIDPRPH